MEIKDKNDVDGGRQSIVFGPSLKLQFHVFILLFIVLSEDRQTQGQTKTKEKSEKNGNGKIISQRKIRSHKVINKVHSK